MIISKNGVQIGEAFGLDLVEDAGVTLGVDQESAGELSVRVTANGDLPAVTITNTVGATVPLTIRAANPQFTQLTEWYDSAGVQVAAVQSDGGLVSNSALTIVGKSTGAVIDREPLINLKNNADGGGDVLKWQLALDVLNSVNDDFVITRGITGGVNDIVYLKDFDPTDAGADVAIGLNATPPSQSRVHIGSKTAQTYPTLLIGLGATQTGDAIRILASDGLTVAFRVGPTGDLHGTQNVRGDAANQRPLTLSKDDGTQGYGFQYSGTSMQFRNFTGGVGVWQADTTGTFALLGTLDASNVITKLAAVTLKDGNDITFPTVTGVKLGTSAAQKIGFFGATAIVQPSGTPAAATDLATAISLVNSLRTSLLALGLVA